MQRLDRLSTQMHISNDHIMENMRVFSAVDEGKEKQIDFNFCFLFSKAQQTIYLHSNKMHKNNFQIPKAVRCELRKLAAKLATL